MPGVSREGFTPKTDQQIIASIGTRLRETYGDDFDTEEQTFAQFMSVFSNELSLAWQAIAQGVTMHNPQNAVEKWLDMICSIINVRRGRPFATVVRYVGFRGGNGLAINQNTFEAQHNNVAYRLINALTIDNQNCWESTFSIGSGSVAGIVLDGVNYQYTQSGALTGVDAAAQITAIINDPRFLIEGDDTTMTISLVDKRESMSVQGIGRLSQVSVTTPGIVRATVTGPNSVPAGTLQISVPVAGLTDIRNPLAGTTGGNVQNDIELEFERRNSFAISKGGTLAGVRAALLDLPGVRVALGRQNRTRAEVAGLPANSYEMIVEGGDPLQIAQTIWDEGPLGIESHGSETYTIQDEEGADQQASYSPIVTRYVHMIVEYQVFDEEFLPSQADNLIRQAVVRYAEERTSEQGKDLLPPEYAGPIYREVPGLYNVRIQLGVTDEPDDAPLYTDAPRVIIGATTKPAFSTTRIAVQTI